MYMYIQRYLKGGEFKWTLHIIFYSLYIYTNWPLFQFYPLSLPALEHLYMFQRSLSFSTILQNIFSLLLILIQHTSPTLYIYYQFDRYLILLDFFTFWSFGMELEPFMHYHLSKVQVIVRLWDFVLVLFADWREV